MVGRFRTVGIDEFVLYRPGSWRPWRPGAVHAHQVFTQVAGDAILALRAEGEDGADA